MPQRPTDAVEPALRSQLRQHLAIAPRSLRPKEIEDSLDIVKIHRQVAQNADRLGKAMDALSSRLCGIGRTKTVIKLRKIACARQIGNDVLANLYE